MKNLCKKIILLVVLLLLAVVIFACSNNKPSNPIGKVNYKVVYHDEILYEKDLDIDNSSVYDLLEKTELEYDMENNMMGYYISSLAGHAEKEEGGMSGWEYFVNDVIGSLPCEKYICSDGDRIMWKYRYEK